MVLLQCRNLHGNPRLKFIFHKFVGGKIYFSDNIFGTILKVLLSQVDFNLK